MPPEKVKESLSHLVSVGGKRETRVKGEENVASD
jgi:hypothetical protein